MSAGVLTPQMCSMPAQLVSWSLHVEHHASRTEEINGRMIACATQTERHVVVHITRADNHEHIFCLIL